MLTNFSNSKRSKRYSNCRARRGTGFGSATPSPSWQQCEQGPTDYFADRQPARAGVQPYSLNQTARELDGKCRLRFAYCYRPFQPLRLLQVAIGLSWGVRTVARQPLDCLGQLIEPLQQGPGAVEALGFLRVAGSAPMSYIL